MNSQTERAVSSQELFERQLDSELEGVNNRITIYKEQLAKATKIVIVAGCDDTRVGVTPEPVQMNGETVMMVYTPKIGGGVPSLEELQSILTTLDDWQCTKNRELILTQHGSTSEIRGQAAAPTCGLRAKHNEVGTTYADEATQFLQLAETHAINSQTEFGQLPDEMKEILTVLSKKTGLPARLLKIALLNNGSGDLRQNSQFVEQATRAILTQAGIEILVSSGVFNHNSKEIILQNGRLLSSGVETWEEDHQDPRLIVISFGKEASVIHDGIVLPEMVGITNNDFSTAAVGNEESLLDALSEAWYASHNHHDAVHGHSHGGNFDHTEACVILCDNQNLVDLAERVLASNEFQNDYKEDYLDLENGIVLVNLETGTQKRVYM